MALKTSSYPVSKTDIEKKIKIPEQKYKITNSSALNLGDENSYQSW